MEITLNPELFNPYYIYNGLEGKALWTKEYVDAFTESARFFLKQEKENRIGSYCEFTEGSPPYIEFWDREEDRIVNGYTYKGVKCPGMYYLYLNYCPIYNKIQEKFTFPDFWDLDFDYFSKLEEAGRKKLYFVSLKARQKGFSLKDAVPLIYNLHFKRGSMNYLMSYLKGYANKTWNFAKHYLNHMNRFTDFYKERNPDRTDFMKMAYEFTDEYGKKTERGYLSEMHKAVFKDSAEKSVGGAINLAVLEEGGVWPNLDEALEFIKPATKDGGIVTGQILLYGSVGDLDKCKTLKEIFYEPENHEFMSFDNWWSTDGNKGKKVGYFIPDYVAFKPFFDACGNSLINTYTLEDVERLKKNRDWQEGIKEKYDVEVFCSIDFIKVLGEREKKKGLKLYTYYRSQHCITPEDAFLSKGKNKYPVELIAKQLAKVEGDDSLKHYGRGVKLQEIDGKIRIETLHEKKTPFNTWPVNFKKYMEDLEGFVWLYEAPMPNTPYELYIGSTDSVDKDKPGAMNSDSLFAMYIYKRSSGQLTEYVKREIVASLIGRPELIADIYLQAEYLEKLYNAKNLVENGNVGILNFHNNRNTDNFLQDELQEIKGLTPNSNVKNRKGYNPTVEVKNHGDSLVIQYLKEVIDTKFDENGEIEAQVFGVERIKDVGLLREMLGYDDDTNCDRLDAFRGCLLYEEALFKKEITLNNGTSISDQFASRVEKSRKKKNSIVW